MDAFNRKFNLWLGRNYWKFTSHSLWKYVLNGLVLLCPPKCLFLKCLLCQNVYSHDVYYGNLQDWADVHARFSNLRSPVCIVLTFLPARDNLKTVWIWIKTVKTVGLIRIQTVCQDSDQVWHFVGPDLVLKLFAKVISRQQLQAKRNFSSVYLTNLQGST